MDENTRIGTPGQIRATKALLKFCRDYNHGLYWIEKLEECLEALKRRDRPALEELTGLICHGGMGSFIDWVPSVAGQGEEYEFVETIWMALHQYWAVAMRPFIRRKRG